MTLSGGADDRQGLSRRTAAIHQGPPCHLASRPAFGAAGDEAAHVRPDTVGADKKASANCFGLPLALDIDRDAVFIEGNFSYVATLRQMDG